MSDYNTARYTLACGHEQEYALVPVATLARMREALRASTTLLVELATEAALSRVEEQIYHNDVALAERAQGAESNHKPEEKKDE